MTKKYLVTYAQNATPVHEKFFEAMQVFCKAENAELIVVPGRYRNPTAPGQDDQDWWAEEVQPYLAARVRRAKDVTTTTPVEKRLARDLIVCADVSINPTSANPLSTFEVYAGHNNCIFGHTSRKLKIIPANGRNPRALYTTSACTVENYSDSKQGKKARPHHVIGALVVEVDTDGVWFARHVSANRKTGAFTDIDRTYTPEGWKPAARVETMTLGDWHDGAEDPQVVEAARNLAAFVHPKFGVLHDFHDFRVRNHHELHKIDRAVAAADKRVEVEVDRCALTLEKLCEDWSVDKWIVVRSNHDEAFERWCREFRSDKDPGNAPYWHSVMARALEKVTLGLPFPNLLEMEMRRLRVPRKVRFLGRNDSFVRKGVEHAMHGDKGPNGTRGSTAGFRKMGTKVTVGHGHTEEIDDGVYRVGLMGKLDQGYNTIPSTWTHSLVLLHEDGKRQVIRIKGGRWRGGQR